MSQPVNAAASPSAPYITPLMIDVIEASSLSNSTDIPSPRSIAKSPDVRIKRFVKQSSLFLSSHNSENREMLLKCVKEVLDYKNLPDGIRTLASEIQQIALETKFDPDRTQKIKEILGSAVRMMGTSPRS